MNLKHPIILASSSPRRRFLLREVGFDFVAVSPDVDESFSSDMLPGAVPAMLAEKKADAISITNEVVVASDTVVILDGNILNKPIDRDDAIRMLTALSGKTHKVVTAVCLRTSTEKEIFDDVTAVTFRTLSIDEISFYVDHYNPLDKAGSYGAQDCLPDHFNPCSDQEMRFLKSIHHEALIDKSVSTGNKIIIIEKIEGSYFNVMGLPIHMVFDRLKHFA